jgi:hypothetical protein
MIYLAWVFLLVACMALSGWIAERRGRSVKLWCWMAFIFGPVAALVVALLPSAPLSSPPPGSAPNGGGLWRRAHERASGGRSEPHSLDLVLIS